MARSLPFLSSVPLAVLTLATGAQAEDRLEAVRFSPEGQAVMSSSIKGFDGITYDFEGRAGQMLKVSFKPSHGLCAFNVVPPGGAKALHVGAKAGPSFDGALPASGTYRTQVFQRRDAAGKNEECKFEISFALTGTPAAGAMPGASAAAAPAPDGEAAAPAPDSEAAAPEGAMQASISASPGAPTSIVNDNALRAACRDAAAGMYGVKTDSVSFSNDGDIYPAGEGFALDGSTDQGGAKYFLCRFDKQRKFVDVSPAQ